MRILVPLVALMTGRTLFDMEWEAMEKHCRP